MSKLRICLLGFLLTLLSLNIVSTRVNPLLGQTLGTGAEALYVSGEWASSRNPRSGVVYKLELGGFAIPKTKVARRLISPLDGVCGLNGTVYFSDYGGNKIIAYDPSEARVQEIAQINRPTSINFDANGDLFINSAQGVWKVKMANGQPMGEPVKITPNFSSGVSIIHGYYRFSRNIGGIAFLNKGPFAGSMVVVDTPGSRVLRFDPPDFSSPKYFITSYSYKGKTASLSTPVGIAINSQGNIFVADAEKREILKFDSSGNYITTLPVRLYIPLHLEFDGLDNLYVTQWGLYIGEGRVTTILPSGDKVRFVTALTDAWGIAVCPREGMAPEVAETGIIIRKVNITVHYDNWEGDVWMNVPAKATWYLYDKNKNLVHTYTYKGYTTHAGGTFGGYIPAGQDGYLRLKVVNKKGEVDWWPGKDQMYKIER